VSIEAYILVLTAAFLHALWNALVKASGDRMAVLGLISLGHVLLGLVLITQVSAPATAAWPYLALTTLIHFSYYFLLYHAYRLGDLSHVYPIARGVAPVLVAVSAQALAGEILPPQAWLGILTVSFGTFLLSWNKRSAKIPRLVVLVSLATGGVIASYSLVDGLGVRVSESPLGYIAWLFVLEIFVSIFIFARRRHALVKLGRKTILMGVFGGIISAIAYGMVIYAKSFSPLGLVSSLRETSVVFASLLGILWLRERPWRPRIIAAFVVAGGVFLIAFA